MNSVKFIMWVEELKSKLNKNFVFSFKNNAQNRVIYSKNETDPSVMILDRKLLKNKKELYGVFYHELGHIMHPIENEYRLPFLIAKILEFGQILLFPYITNLGKFMHYNFGISYIVGTFFTFYAIKIILNHQFENLTNRLKESEYISDAFSYVNDPHQDQLRKFKDSYFSLSLRDLFVRIVPVFVLITHPTIKERIQALEEKKYINKVKKIN